VLSTQGPAMPKQAAFLRNYCFTANNWTFSTRSLLEKWDVRYLVFGEEVAPTTGTPHLQGYVQLKTRKRISTLAKEMPGLHFIAANGTAMENRSYCLKEGHNVFEKGAASIQGKMNVDTMYDYFVMVDGDAKKMYDEFGESWLRNRRQILELSREIAGNMKRELISANIECCTLRKWQSEAVERLMKQDDRKILFVVDKKGGAGKSWLADYMRWIRGAFVTQGGRTVDITYAYASEDIVAFDICRSGQKFMNYMLIERFKNSCVSSHKYESCEKVAKARVVVFLNDDPDYTKLSEDRYDIMHV
jgi:hypothetical protein